MGRAIGSPLALHWDGTGWSRVPVPQPDPDPRNDAELRGIAAVGANPNDIWAVGNYFAWPNQGSLIEHWDGVQWSLAYTDTARSRLRGVAAISSNDVWAVGEVPDENGRASTLIKHWDGTQWSTVPSPNPGTGTGNHLTSVAAISANDVWAVGYSEITQDGGLAMHWDGSMWSVVPLPGGMQMVSLNGVAARATDDVWAVGRYGIFPGIRTLVLHWDGTQWGQVYSPSVSPDWAALNAVTIDAEGNIWAARALLLRPDCASRAVGRAIPSRHLLPVQLHGRTDQRLLLRSGATPILQWHDNWLFRRDIPS